LGIDVESNSGAPVVTVSNNSVQRSEKWNYRRWTWDWRWAGYAITSNTVTGIGATPCSRKTAFQIGRGSTGKVTSNTVADDICTGWN
jgi:hypothetical protein